MEDPARIVVRRPQGGARDLLRKYRIEIDGKRAGEVARGDEVEFSVAAGEHRVRATIDWLGSQTLRLGLTPGEVARLTVEPGGHPLQLRSLFSQEGYVLPLALLGIFLFFFGLNGWLHHSVPYGWAVMLGRLLCYLLPLAVVRLLRRRRGSDR